MTDNRIKLTEEDIKWSEFDMNDSFWQGMTIEVEEEDFEKRKQQILENQESANELREIRKTGLIFTDREWVQDQLKTLREKAEKYDNMNKSIYESKEDKTTVSLGGLLDKLEQENKQLKEKLHKLKKQGNNHNIICMGHKCYRHNRTINDFLKLEEMEDKQ